MTEHFVKPAVYAAWSLDRENRYKSTSGGAFTEIGKVVLQRGGYVSGARYQEDCMVGYDLVHDMKGLEKLRQSKYVQSESVTIFSRVKKKLDTGQMVCFAGAPCQVAGLYSFLVRDYDNLITLDFICRGMNSPKAYKAWLKELEMKEKSRVTGVWFRYKDGGWKTSPRRTRVDFANGHHKVFEDEKNLYMYGYLSANLYMKPSCGTCCFKGVPRYGDITLADFWGAGKKLDNDRGTSIIMVNSSKGIKLFEDARLGMEVHEITFESVLEENVCISDSVKISDDSENFLRDLDTMSFSDALKKYNSYPARLPLTQRINRKIRRTAKRILMKAGVI